MQHTAGWDQGTAKNLMDSFKHCRRPERPPKNHPRRISEDRRDDVGGVDFGGPPYVYRNRIWS